MSKRLDQPTSKLRLGEPGYVGRDHPPEHGRIKKGEIKNPYGRRGKPKAGEADTNFASEMRVLFAQPIRTKDGQTYSHAELMMNSVIKLLAAGDVKGHRMYLELWERFGTPPERNDSLEELADADEAILESYRQEVLASSGGKRSDEANGDENA